MLFTWRCTLFPHASNLIFLLIISGFDEASSDGLASTKRWGHCIHFCAPDSSQINGLQRKGFELSSNEHGSLAIHPIRLRGGGACLSFPQKKSMPKVPLPTSDQNVHIEAFFKPTSLNRTNLTLGILGSCEALGCWMTNKVQIFFQPYIYSHSNLVRFRIVKVFVLSADCSLS